MSELLGKFLRNFGFDLRQRRPHFFFLLLDLTNGGDGSLAYLVGVLQVVLKFFWLTVLARLVQLLLGGLLLGLLALIQSYFGVAAFQFSHERRGKRRFSFVVTDGHRAVVGLLRLVSRAICGSDP